MTIKVTQGSLCGKEATVVLRENIAIILLPFNCPLTSIGCCLSTHNGIRLNIKSQRILTDGLNLW